MFNVPKFVPPVWLLPCFFMMVALDYFLPIYEWLPNPWHYIGIIPLLLSLVITGRAARLLGRSDTTIAPSGTATHLVVTGLYRFTRNPMYLGMTCILLGVAVLFGTVSALIPVFIYMWIIQELFIIPEERRLKAAFGDECERFFSSVRRWI